MHPAWQKNLPKPIQTPHGETVYELLGNSAGPAGCQHSIAYVEIDPGRASIRHYHPKTEESYTILEGEGIMKRGKQSCPAHAGCVFHIPPGVVHHIENTGEQSLRMWVACVPPWTPDCSVFLEKWDEKTFTLKPINPPDL